LGRKVRLRGHPGREPDLKGLSSGPHVSEAKGINSFEEVLAVEFE
jgi:hypothetical protein